MQVARKHGLPYVVSEHSSTIPRAVLPMWKKDLIARVVEQSSAVTAVSRALAEAMRREIRINSLPEVLPNMVDTDFFDFPSAPRRSRPFTFIAIGFMSRNKGFDVLIRAFARHAMQDSGTRLRIVGSGREHPALVRLAKQLGLDGKVTFVGPLDRSGIRDEFHRANAIVSASFVETFGLVVAEAMATGLPVIYTKSGGPQEIVKPDLGLAVEPGHLRGLADAMSAMKSRADLYTPVRQRQAIVRRYSRPAVAGRLQLIYETVLGRPTT